MHKRLSPCVYFSAEKGVFRLASAHLIWNMNISMATRAIRLRVNPFDSLTTKVCRKSSRRSIAQAVVSLCLLFCRGGSLIMRAPTATTKEDTFTATRARRLRVNPFDSLASKVCRKLSRRSVVQAVVSLCLFFLQRREFFVWRAPT